MPSYVPDDENEVIRPAVFGVINVFTACVQPGSKVRRVIYTSSIAAISGDNFEDKIYTESDYSKEDDNRGYIKSKVLAERAAWNFVKERQNKGLDCFELVVLNPGYIMVSVFNALKLNFFQQTTTKNNISLSSRDLSCTTPTVRQ